MPSYGLSPLRAIGFLCGSVRRRLVLFLIIVFLFTFALIRHPTTRTIGYNLYDTVSVGAIKRLDDPKELVAKLGPPDYKKLKQWEADLPQHNLDLPFPEGKSGRYVKFSNQIRMLGWNNVFNEVLMNAFLAYESNRTYVFQDYVWKPEYYAWKEDQFLENPPRTPLNAIISGPVSGGLWEPGDNSPRSISERWFDVVCPVTERRVINTRDIKTQEMREWMGDRIFEHWKKILVDAPENCVEIWPAEGDEDSYPQTFDLWLWGSYRVLPLWEPFSKSPVSRLLKSSPIVNSAVDRNEYIFFPHGPRPQTPASTDPFERMLAMHVRRGDYENACTDLATWNSTYYSWNLIKSLPDRFEPPSGGSFAYNTPENTAKYMEHCLPTFDAIVQKVRDSRAEYVEAGKGKGYRTLDVLYLLTNEESDWLDRLKAALRKDGWYTIRTSRDLVLDQEQTDVNMAIDMDIARRAAVFLGNGWSSFTSNIVHRRLVDGKEPISNRFF